MEGYNCGKGGRNCNRSDRRSHASLERGRKLGWHCNLEEEIWRVAAQVVVCKVASKRGSSHGRA